MKGLKSFLCLSLLVSFANAAGDRRQILPLPVSSASSSPSVSHPPSTSALPTTSSSSLTPSTSAPPPSSSSPTSTSTPPPTTTSSADSKTESLTSLTPSIITGGSVVVTVTATSSTGTSSSAAPTTTTASSSDSSGGGLGMGSIIGLSVAGGVALLGIIGFFVWKFTRKRFSGFDDNEAIKWPDLNNHGAAGADSHPLPVNNTGRSGFDTGSEGSLSRVESSNYSTPDFNPAADPYAVPPLPHMNPNQPYRDDPAGGAYYDPYRGPIPGTIQPPNPQYGESIPMTQMLNQRSSPAPMPYQNSGRQSPRNMGYAGRTSPGPQAVYGGRMSPGLNTAYGGAAPGYENYTGR